MRYPRTCRNGHAIDGPEDEVPHGEKHFKCKRCQRAREVEYSRTPKGRASARRKSAKYSATEAGKEMYARYEGSTKGMVRRARAELHRAHQRLETL